MREAEMAIAPSLVLDAVEELLPAVVSRFAGVREADNGSWIRADEAFVDRLGCQVVMAAGLHPADARDAARRLVEMLTSRGLCISPEPSRSGNGLGARLARLADVLAGAAPGGFRVEAVAAALSALAGEVQEREEAAVPAHLRLVPGALPSSVVRLEARRART
ncbi:hypothetical protein [Roseicella frigidaeris]|uniref:Uncharacterized protein n=1 Tax=Roseicella frigidaeris TaxID=2230885 RepID=A0A327M748_9PROT|nr:hypothetical protein [Roseicella frigidaeris]RAI55908.1 hypothetical protein DOO78_23450 [Roseicella frigidaeris]